MFLDYIRLLLNIENELKSLFEHHQEIVQVGPEEYLELSWDSFFPLLDGAVVLSDLVGMWCRIVEETFHITEN